MDIYWRYIILAIILCCKLSNCLSSVQDESGLNDDRECDLGAASKCINSLHNNFNCYLNLSTECSPETEITKGTFEDICNLLNDTLNGCLMDMLGYGCKGTTKHGFYKQWLTPLNAALNKLCDRNESMISDLTEALKSNCTQGHFIKCLLEMEKKIDFIDLVSSEMVTETCTDLEVRLQLCLDFDDSQCKSLVDIVLDFSKEFVDNAPCSNQPIIMVPLEDKDNPNSKESEDERDCAPQVAKECFLQVDVKWKCYFQDKKCPTNFTEICTFTEQAINTCGMFTLGYGCENTENHYYKDWLNPMNEMYKKMCEDNGSHDEESIKNTKSCWGNFIACFQKSDIAGNSVNLITKKITSSVCTDLIDNVESCFSGLNFPQCDQMLETVQNMKVMFRETACKLEEQLSNKKSVTNLTVKSKFSLNLMITFVVFYYFA